MIIKNTVIILIISIALGEEQYFIKINNKEYEFELKDNEAANQIKSKLPFTVTMTRLNGNEIYYQFTDESFTTNTKSVGTINMGDIYLYQSDYLVLFYKTFSTPYSYTELGKLKDPSGLDSLINSNNVEVQWFIKNSETEETAKETVKETVKETTEEINKDTSKDTIGGSTDGSNQDTNKVNTEETDENNGFERYSFFEYVKMNYFIWLVLAFTQF